MGFLKTIKRKYINLNEYLFGGKNLKLSKKNILITGSNSGIGLCIFKKITSDNNVLAFVNNNSDEVSKFKTNNSYIVKCDFSDISNLEKYNQSIKDFKPNIIINCAATFGDSTEIKNIDFEKYRKVLNINVLAPVLIIQNSLETNNLELILNISSEMGSIDLNKTGNYYYYRSSKSLLNSFSKNLSIELKNKVNVYCVHPGNVKTKMNTGGILNPEFAAQKIINICATNDNKLSGVLIDINKNILPW